MGWGCVKHEWDAHSYAWREHVEKMSDERIKTHKDWGRDEEICPKCWEDIQKQNEELYHVIKELVDAIGIENADEVVFFRGRAKAILDKYDKTYSM